MGIGGTNPTAQLQVNTLAGTDAFKVGSSTTQFLVDAKGNVFIGPAGLNGYGDLSVYGSDINIGNDGKATSTIKSLGGRLGIYDNSQSSTTPGAILSVHAASTTAGALLVNQTLAGPIFTVQDNGSTVFDVRDGGNIMVTSAATSTFTGGVNVSTRAVCHPPQV